MEKAKTIAVNLLVTALIAILLIWGNTLYRQWQQFRCGERALAANRIIPAIAGYEAAIHMYTPLSPLVERSAARLWEITARCEKSRDLEQALIACRALRSSFYADRGLFQPGREWIARCDAKIAELLKARESLKTK
ncbi:MAG TPA: hypothetical protein VF799_02610 [Geobacteraceae bacterium]